MLLNIHPQHPRAVTGTNQGNAAAAAAAEAASIEVGIEALPQLDPAECVVMFPSEDALLPDQLPLEQLKHVILIDSKWRRRWQQQ